ncbi:hypothetical protein A2U01_0094358, partial [Trifolium medium]|nr:hypothetical protein [Trifolium medium]
ALKLHFSALPALAGNCAQLGEYRARRRRKLCFPDFCWLLRPAWEVPSQAQYTVHTGLTVVDF